MFDLEKIPSHSFRFALDSSDYEHYLDYKNRRLYLLGEIQSADSELVGGMSTCTALVDQILDYNRADRELDPEDRQPVRLYINSPGGEIVEGFALVSAIKLSKTPVYTINLGQWSSMAFLIGITGHKRFSLPQMTFLMHDGSTLNYGSASKVQDKADFDKRFEREVIRRHVLDHSKMSEVEYDALARVEYYLLPEDALKRGFIDEIVTDIDAIL